MDLTGPRDVVVGDFLLKPGGERFRIKSLNYLHYRAVGDGNPIEGSIRDLIWDESQGAWLMGGNPPPESRRP